MLQKNSKMQTKTFKKTIERAKKAIKNIRKGKVGEETIPNKSANKMTEQERKEMEEKLK